MSVLGEPFGVGFKRDQDETILVFFFGWGDPLVGFESAPMRPVEETARC